MIDKKTIERIAKLGRLQISEKEAQEYSEQLSKVVGYFEQISSVDTKGVEPLVTPSDMKAFWREDIAKQELTPAGTTQAAVENHFPEGVYFHLTQQGWGISIAKAVEPQRRHLRRHSP